MRSGASVLIVPSYRLRVPTDDSPWPIAGCVTTSRRIFRGHAPERIPTADAQERIPTRRANLQPATCNL